MDYREFGKTGFKVSSIGMGTYYGVMSRVFAGAVGHRSAENDKLKVLRRGIELGMNLIDTAEVYGTEELVGEAVNGQKRDDLFIATKVWPSHLHYDDVLRSASSSLTKLKLAFVDLYQIHWPDGRIPIKETMRAMDRLVDEGKVRYVGVSSFSVAQTKEAQEALSKHDLASNQVEYSLLARGIEEDLLPYCKSSGIAVLAYRPLAHGALANPSGRLESVMKEISRAHNGRTSAQIALNWLLTRGENVFPIPRASRLEHVMEDAGASGWRLGEGEVSALLGATRQ